MLKPMFNRVMVIPNSDPAVTKGGIHIPDSARKKVTNGTVVAVGPGKPLTPDVVAKLSPHMTVDLSKAYIPMAVKVGDTVHYGEYTGHVIRATLDGEERDFVVLLEDDILAFERGGEGG